LVGQTLVHLGRDTDLRARLADDRDLLPRAVEEFLRVFSPAQALARTVTQPTEVAGCPLEAGDRVLLAWSSANRDVEQFTDPDEVDVERWPNRHLSFGAGVHRCAGAHLARLMSVTMLREILERMPDYRLQEEGLAPYATNGVNAGWRAIPVTFTPGFRLAEQ